MQNMIILLVIFYAMGLQPIESTPTVTMIESNPGLLFEKLGNTHLIFSQWNLVTYYNLTGYTTELLGLLDCIAKIKSLCKPLRTIDPRSNSCEMIVLQLNSHMTDINSYNDALFPQIPSRTRRSLVDAGGAALHYVFGVLDQNSADQYDNKIAKIKTDQSYLLELIKNQTLIIETSHHIMRQTNNTLYHQFDMFQHHLNQIDVDANWEKTRSTLNRDLTGLFMYTSLMLTRFKDTQKILLETLSNSKLGVVHPLILPPKVLRQQLQFIQNHLPTHLSLPKIGHIIDAKTIFLLTQIKSRLNKDKLILEINLPLISTENYQTFKMISVPFKVNTHYVYVTPNLEFLTTNLLRDRYTSMSSDEFKECILTSAGSYVCKPQAPIHTTTGTPVIPCEVKLLNNPTKLPSDCKLTVTNKKKFWIPVIGNKFVFVLDEQTTVDSICEPNVTHLELGGSGTLLIENGCCLRDGDTVIFPKILQNTSVNSSYVPSMNISFPQSKIESWRARKPVENPISQSDPISEDYLTHLIEQQKRSEDDLHKTLNVHDVTHYATDTALFLVILILIILYIARRKGYTFGMLFRRSDAIPITDPDTVYSIPIPTLTTNHPEPASRVFQNL